MTANKVLVAGVATILALITLIAWGFYDTLQMESDRKIKLADAPQKAVMTQIEAMNQSRLNKMVQSGKVTKGMNEKQVRTALGEPARYDPMEQDDQQLTVWWYEHEGWMSVVFDNKGLVSRIEKRP